MDEVSVIHDHAAATAALDPLRSRILRRLTEPGSATTVAKSLDMSRQRIAYHVRALEKLGLLQHVENVRKGNCTERVVRATARRYLVSPQALARIGPDSLPMRDRFSSTYLIALAAQTIDDLARLRQDAGAARQRLPTLSVSTRVAFRSQREQQRFADDLTQAIAEVSARYPPDRDPPARTFRLMLGAYPIPGRAGTRDEGTDSDEQEG